MQPLSFEISKDKNPAMPLALSVTGAETRDEQLTLIGILEEGGVEASAAIDEDREALRVVVDSLSSAQEFRETLAYLDDHPRIELAESIGKTLHKSRKVTGEEAEGVGYIEKSGMKVVFAGTEYGPYSQRERAEIKELKDQLADTMNRIVDGHGIENRNRYYGSFPYPDEDTGACKLKENLSLPDKTIRDAIVSLMRCVIEEKEISDIAVESSDQENKDDIWPYEFSVTAMGGSIVSILDAYRSMYEFLNQVEEKMLLSV